MEDLVPIGRRRTIWISIAVLFVSLHAIYFYNVTVPDVPTKKIIQQIIRFILTVLLLVLVYKGREWARWMAVVLFAIGAIGALISVFAVNVSSIAKVPLIVMVIVFSASAYHFAFSNSFKAFFEHQRGSRDHGLEQ